MYIEDKNADLKNMPENILACLGETDVVYIRPIKEDGKIVFGVFSASGHPIDTFDTMDHAKSAAWLNELTPLYCH